MHLHIDIETYSSADIKKVGAYKYTEAPDFEVLMVAFAIGDAPVRIFDWEDRETSAEAAEFFAAFQDPRTGLVAHNATFERLAFRRVGMDAPPERWLCTAIKSSYCGLPMSLGEVSKALQLTSGKLDTGSALIRYFSIPCKPTLTNGGRTRNRREDNPEKWQQFREYCVRDVEAEREIAARLSAIPMPAEEWRGYWLDQRINDRGVRIDDGMVLGALKINDKNVEALAKRLADVTQLENPNSVAQLKQWVSSQTGTSVESLSSDAVDKLLAGGLPALVREALTIRQELSRTSIKKYVAMQHVAGTGRRARGLFQFYGAGRTGRWAGRLIQLQNLPRNYLHDLSLARQLVAAGDFDTLALCFDVSDTLSQLIRTALVPSEGKLFGVADYSAIEARVLSWLAGETWRLDVFATHGKIYEASASRMFGVPIESIGKGSDLRQKGKVAELALGYQGGANALVTMGGDKMGLSSEEMESIVKKWRQANPRIVRLWYNLQDAALRAVKLQTSVKLECGVRFTGTPTALRVTLPSGRQLVYWQARIAEGRYGEAVKYWGVDSKTKRWALLDTYGGKLAENVVQAVSRDLLLHSLKQLEELGVYTVMHVHDEIVAEIAAESELEELLATMSAAPDWAAGLPLTADGYTCGYYMKD